MGYDVSFHPVDVELIENEIVPIILGEKDPAPLFERAAIAARNRFLANAWGLGLVQLESEQFLARSEAPKKGVFARLFGRGKDSDSDSLAGFDSDIYVWGRPYLITAVDDALYEAIDRYSLASPEDTEALAQQMIRDLWPGMADRVRKDASPMPSMDEFLHGAAWKIQLFRDAVQAMRDGSRVRMPEGDEHDPVELLNGDAQMAILEFQSVLVPGWMARGRVAPTHLYREAEMESEFIESSAAPFQSLVNAVPDLSLRSDTTIDENFMVGGYVSARNVPAFRKEFERVFHTLQGPAQNDGWVEELEVAASKIEEALIDAERRRVGFVEASEIYSGPMGMMN